MREERERESEREKQRGWKRVTNTQYNTHRHMDKLYSL